VAQEDKLPLSQRIVFEDNHVLVVNKTSSELVQGDKTGDPSILDELKKLIKERDQKPGNVFLGLVHRLDRPTSGLVIVAKTSKALSRLTGAFRDRLVSKDYLVITEKGPEGPDLSLEPKGLMEDLLGRNEKTNTSKVVAAGGQEARLEYELIQTLDSYLVWQVRLDTGRHHQIRVQFASRGFPVRGDLKYGARRSIPGGGIGLHAWRLDFPHPTRGERRVVLTADPTKSQSDPLWKQVECPGP